MIEKLLQRIVKHLPFRTIATDGSPYLTRWYVWPRGPRTGSTDPVGSDGVTPQSPFAVFIHFFHRGDDDRDQHNHPWGRSISLVLSGGYREERGDTVRIVKPWSLNVIKKDDFHRVDLLDPVKGCWSLFIAGTSTQNWGFKLRDSGRFVPWREYLNER